MSFSSPREICSRFSWHSALESEIIHSCFKDSFNYYFCFKTQSFNIYTGQQRTAPCRTVLGVLSSWSPSRYSNSLRVNFHEFSKFLFSKFQTEENSIWELLPSMENEESKKPGIHKIGPSGAHYYFCFNLSLIIESYLEYQYTPV